MNSTEIELDMVIQSAHNMVSQTRIGENKINEMLSRAHRVAEKIASMYRYEKMLEDMRSLTVNGNRRKIILNELQRENRQIMALQDENRQLREATDECFATMREIVDTDNEIKESIKFREQYSMIDDADQVLCEMSNRPVEISLKNKANDMQKMMNEMTKVKREEDHKVLLAVQKNKNYREMLELACFSNPGAVRELRTALKTIFAEIEGKVDTSKQLENIDGEGDNEEEEEEEDDDVMNSTIQHNTEAAAKNSTEKV